MDQQFINQPFDFKISHNVIHIHVHDSTNYFSCFHTFALSALQLPAMTPDWTAQDDAGFFDDMIDLYKRVPAWFQGDKDHQTVAATLPWFGLDVVECELNHFVYVVRTSHTRPILPPLGILSQFWAAWDTELSDDTQFHFVIFDWCAYQDVYRTISDDAVNLIDDGDIAEIHRLQTWIRIHYFDPSDLVDTVGHMHRSLLQLREDHETLLRRFETWREHTSRLMEWVAANDPKMAGPLDLLLRPADRLPERPEPEPTPVSTMSRSTSAGT